MKLRLLAAGVSLMPVVGSTVPVMVSHVVPTAKCNRALMVVSGIMALSGLPAPAVTGYLIDRGGAHGHDWAFLCGAVVALVGGLLSLLLLRRTAMTPLAGDQEV
jgi:MFS family permease